MARARAFLDPESRHTGAAPSIRFPPKDPSTVTFAALLPPEELVGKADGVWIDLFAALFTKSMHGWRVTLREGVDGSVAGAHLAAVIDSPQLRMIQKELVCCFLMKEWVSEVSRDRPNT